MLGSIDTRYSRGTRNEGMKERKKERNRRVKRIYKVRLDM